MPTVIIVESNTSGNAYHVIKAAQKLGVFCHFLTRQKTLWQTAKYDPVSIADKVSIADTINPADMLLAIRHDSDITAIIWFDEIRMLPCVMLSTTLGLIDADTANKLITARYKDKVRSVINQVSLPIYHRLIDDVADMPNIGDLILPCVVKPVDDSGSFGVVKCTDRTQVIQAMDFIKNRPQHISGYRRMPQALIEQYIAGDEYSAEFGWCSAAGWVLIGYTKKIKSPEPVFVELAHIFPYSFGDELDDDICQTLTGCLQALGLKNCVAHVEFKLHKGQVFVVEINPRLAGDMIVDLVRTACGVDMGKIAYLSHTGTPWAADLTIKQSCCAATAYLYSEQAGTVVSISTDGRQQDQWLRVLPRYNTGSLTSSDDRPGCVIATADTWQAALQKAQHIADTAVISFGEI